MKAKKIICLNQVEIAQCERLGVPKDRLVIVPNGVNLDEYVNLPQKGSFRKRWSISNDQKIILFLARIHKIKGPDLLAKAFTLISKNNNNLKLVFAGPDGGYLTFLKGLIRELGIEEKVLFTGPLYERDKFEAYVDADVYVLPSVYETFPISIIEACACGTPVIVTDRCGIANIIDGQVGLVVPYNADALGEAIVWVERADQVFSFGQVKPCLTSKRSVYHGKESGWDDHPIHSPHEGRGGEAGHITDHSTTQGYDCAFHSDRHPAASPHAFDLPGPGTGQPVPGRQSFVGGPQRAGGNL